MLITAAGSVKPAKVLIIGAGVAGLQAIATAKRLVIDITFLLRVESRIEVLAFLQLPRSLPECQTDKVITEAENGHKKRRKILELKLIMVAEE